MKLLIGSLFLASLAIKPASAVITLGTSSQNFTLTGIGPNNAGQGQSKMSWGSCTYDGANTTCTLSGSYTGLGPGGMYAFVVTYAGNGAFPLNAITNPGSNQFTASATGNFTFEITLTPTTGSPINFYSFYNFNFQYISPTCTGVSVSSCSVSQVGQTAGATITGQINGTFDPSPVILPGGALTPDGYGSSLSTAPGDWIVMYGYNLATIPTQTWAGSNFTNGIGPTNLGGTTVTVGGVPAYVDYVSPGQVNIEVASNTPTGNQNIVVTTAGGSSSTYAITVNAVNPGILAPSGFIFNGNQYIVAQLTVGASTYYVLPSTVTGIPVTQARPGDTITIYGIGFGPVTPTFTAGQIVTASNAINGTFKASIGGVNAQVIYAGLVPSIVGLYQFNIVVPNIPANNATPITFSLNGTAGTQTNMVIPIASN